MGPDLWTAFVFFGIPLVLGLLGILTGGRLCYHAYVQYTVGRETEWTPSGGSNDQPESEQSWRGNLLRGVPILVGSTLLTLHSTRWVIRIFGFP